MIGAVRGGLVSFFVAMDIVTGLFLSVFSIAFIAVVLLFVTNR